MSAQEPQFVVIEQHISAGRDWDGTSPSTDPVFTVKGLKGFPEDTHGGLFEWNFSSFFLMEVQRISVDFAGVGTKRVAVRRQDGSEILIFSSTDPLETNILITDKIQLAVDEKVVIFSTGATVAMSARVIARPLHPEPSSVLG
jgi:hypothetical protein